MSLKKISLLTALVVFGVGAGAALMGWMDHLAPSRRIASENWRPLPIGKHLAPVSVQIKALGGLPERDDQEVELTGYVTLNVPADQDLHFQWDLPEGVSVVDGETSDAWSQVGPGQTAVAKISVVGFSREHRRVLTLEGFVQLGDRRLGNSAAIASSVEGTMDEVAPAMMEAKRNDEAEGKGRRHK